MLHPKVTSEALRVLLFLCQACIAIRDRNTKFSRLLHNLQTFLCPHRRSYHQHFPPKSESYQFQRHMFDCTSKAYQHLVHCGQEKLYVLKVANGEYFCCYHNLSAKDKVEFLTMNECVSQNSSLTIG